MLFSKQNRKEQDANDEKRTFDCDQVSQELKPFIKASAEYLDLEDEVGCCQAN
ncbi:hypothetical protein QQM79_19805 [Marinobacteraceae bacterium S3BR75-40.1]